MSATDAAIKKKIHGSSATALIILNEEMEDIMKIVKSLEESRLLIKRIRETIKNKAKKRKGRFLPMLSGTLGASMLGNALPVKVLINTSKSKFLMLPHPLTNFEIQKSC